MPYHTNLGLSDDEDPDPDFLYPDDLDPRDELPLPFLLLLPPLLLFPDLEAVLFGFVISFQFTMSTILELNCSLSLQNAHVNKAMFIINNGVKRKRNSTQSP